MAAWVLACVGAIGCSEVDPRQAHDYSDRLESDFCIKETVLLSDLLSDAEGLASCLSSDDCDRSIDAEEGHFETWHVYADFSSNLVLEAESEFDNLMELMLVTDHSEDQIQQEPIAKNDDRSMTDLRARISAPFEANQNYLIRLSTFGYDERGCYTIEAEQVSAVPTPPSSGSIEVTVSSRGGAPVEYTVTLNGAKEKSVAANGTVAYGDIVTGEYALELGGVGDCTANEENPQSVTVNADETTRVSFEMECPCKADTPDGTSCDGGAGRCQSGVCVQSPPSLSNPIVTNLDINQCTDPKYPGYTTYSYVVSYSDPDGDVTPSGTRVFLSSRDNFGIMNGPIEIPEDNVIISGDGSDGSIAAEFCVLFQSAEWMVFSMVVWDNAENASNLIEQLVSRPPGAD